MAFIAPEMSLVAERVRSVGVVNGASRRCLSSAVLGESLLRMVFFLWIKSLTMRRLPIVPRRDFALRRRKYHCCSLSRETARYAGSSSESAARLAPNIPSPTTHGSSVSRTIFEVDDDSSLNLAAMHARENVVNVVERLRGDGRLDFAFAGEVQSFLQIEAGSDDRTANGDSVEDGSENR